MRICIFSSSTVPVPTWRWTGYGSEIVAWWLARELAGRGHSVALFAPYSSIPPDGVEMHYIPSSYGLNNPQVELAGLRRNLDILRGCDVVHDMSANSVAAEWGWVIGRPVVMSKNGYDTTRPASTRRNVVVISEAVRTYFERMDELAYGRRVHYEVVPYGVPVDDYPFSEVKGKYVLYLGRPHPSKGVDLILRAAAKLRGVKFLLAWRPTFYDHMDYHAKYLRAAKGLRNVHIFVLPGGWTGEQVKRAALSRARLFVQPTIYLEAFGLTAAEAMAAGTPVLLSTAGSGPELVKDGVGLLVRNKLDLLQQANEWQKHIDDAIDVEELAQKIEEGLESKWSCRGIREYARERFDISRMADSYIKLYEKALRGGWG